MDSYITLGRSGLRGSPLGLGHKEQHHCVVLDGRGERLLSRRVLNDETALLELISDVPTATSSQPYPETPGSADLTNDRLRPTLGR
ncbi:hypothetical protein GCM10010145_62090 [Streptomyces ruber]|uniref:Uncharacterized protein n=2 Tax=Streptomyces TaxID=1883 RepID=A0A918BPE7_9ACTN|nr:hypothetical protein GCM10010145_62090 [Streptomyces ruber]